MSDLFVPAPKVAKITAADIRSAMAKRWAAPEWAIMWEVGRATGAVARQRYADAVMMSLWPSRGLELHGVEIKVSRSDWRREAADPTKAEEVAAYCDRWWVHTAAGVVQDLSEVPPAWGLREFDGRAWRTIREAEKTMARVCDRTFLAALLRRADEVGRAQIEREAKDIAAATIAATDERIKNEVERRTHDFEDLSKEVAAFEEASGLCLRDYMLGGPKEIGALVRMINALGVRKAYGGVSHVLQSLKITIASVDRAIAESGLTEPPEPS